MKHEISVYFLVDVSETFSADQLCFRIISGLFQCCSLPKNLWTGLTQSWTALICDGFRMIMFGNFFNFFSKNLEVPQFWPTWFRFSSLFAKRSKETTEIRCSTFLRAKYITKTRRFGISVTAQVTKLIWFNFSKASSRLVGWTFKTFRIRVFLSFYKILVQFTTFEYEECHFDNHFKRFHHFWLDSLWNSAEFSILSSADSKKIRTDQLRKKACSLNQRWKLSKLWKVLFSADYLWDFKPGSHVM